MFVPINYTNYIPLHWIHMCMSLGLWHRNCSPNHTSWCIRSISHWHLSLLWYNKIPWVWHKSNYVDLVQCLHEGKTSGVLASNHSSDAFHEEVLMKGMYMAKSRAELISTSDIGPSSDITKCLPGMVCQMLPRRTKYSPHSLSVQFYQFYTVVKW